MHHLPVWLTVVDDSLLIIQFFTPTNQGEWWCASNPFPLFLIIVSTETRWTNINGPNRRDVWYFKCCSHSECSFTQFNWVQLRKIYSLFHSTIVSSQCERLCSAHVSLVVSIPVLVYFRTTTETPLTKLNRLKRSEIWHCKWFGTPECIITQLDWLKLRKIYFSFHSFNFTSQREWWCRIETSTTNLYGFKCIQFC